jgi:hypothetical protein
MTTELRSIGDKITPRRATAVVQQTAGATAAITGLTIDRAAIGWPESAVVAIPFSATLGAANTASLAYTFQSSQADNMGSPATIVAAEAAVVATGGGGGTTESGMIEVNVSLRGAGRYVRLNITPTLSAANTDTVRVVGSVIFGGANRLPQ